MAGAMNSGDGSFWEDFSEQEEEEAENMLVLLID